MEAKLWSTGLALVFLAASVPAAATLGEDASSVSADQAQLQATLEIAAAAKFAVHRLQLPSGTVVKEYVSPAGMVFAVSWQGPSIPDLRQVLGRYFETYVGAVKRQGASAVHTIQQPPLVVQTGGHMRAYFGTAYVPPMLPRGVLAEDIQ